MTAEEEDEEEVVVVEEEEEANCRTPAAKGGLVEERMSRVRQKHTITVISDGCRAYHERSSEQQQRTIGITASYLLLISFLSFSSPFFYFRTQCGRVRLSEEGRSRNRMLLMVRLEGGSEVGGAA